MKSTTMKILPREEWDSLPETWRDWFLRGQELEEKFGDCGIGPRVGGQFKMFKRMEDAGYVRFEGYGRDIDEGYPNGNEVMVYRLTAKTQILLMAVGED